MKVLICLDRKVFPLKDGCELCVRYVPFFVNCCISKLFNIFEEDDRDIFSAFETLEILRIASNFRLCRGASHDSFTLCLNTYSMVHKLLEKFREKQIFEIFFFGDCFLTFY